MNESSHANEKGKACRKKLHVRIAEAKIQRREQTSNTSKRCIGKRTGLESCYVENERRDKIHPLQDWSRREPRHDDRNPSVLRLCLPLIINNNIHKAVSGYVYVINF